MLTGTWLHLRFASRYDRLRRRGMLTTQEVAAKFKISETTVHDWGRQGLIKKCCADSLNRGLWEIASDTTIRKGHGGHGSYRPRPFPATAQSQG